MKLELVPVPVTDVDRAKSFYVEQLGFTVEVDISPAEGIRIVQLTPPGSACSIGLGTGLPAYEGRPVHLLQRGADRCHAFLRWADGIDLRGQRTTVERSKRGQQLYITTIAALPMPIGTQRNIGMIR